METGGQAEGSTFPPQLPSLSLCEGPMTSVANSVLACLQEAMGRCINPPEGRGTSLIQHVPTSATVGKMR